MNSADRNLYTIRRLTELTELQLHGLAQVLVDCVEGGASVSFMHPLPLSRALAFWRRVADDVHSGACALLVAEDASSIVGTVQLVLAQPKTSRIAPISPRCWCIAAPGAWGSELRSCAARRMP